MEAKKRRGTRVECQFPQVSRAVHEKGRFRRGFKSNADWTGTVFKTVASTRNLKVRVLTVVMNSPTLHSLMMLHIEAVPEKPLFVVDVAKCLGTPVHASSRTEAPTSAVMETLQND